jgi:hypothetical protein
VTAKNGRADPVVRNPSRSRMPAAWMVRRAEAFAQATSKAPGKAMTYGHSGTRAKGG